MAQLRLPNEVLLKIFGYYSVKGRQWERWNIRLSSKLFCQLANVHFFEHICLDQPDLTTLEWLRSAVDLLSQPHIAVHIRSIVVGSRSLLPVSEGLTRYASGRVELKDVELTHRIAAFTVDLTRLLGSCRSSLRDLKLRGVYLTEIGGYYLSKGECSSAEQCMIEIFGELLSTIDLPMLNTISFSAKGFPPLEVLVEAYSSDLIRAKLEGLLIKNLQRVKNIIIRFPRIDSKAPSLASMRVLQWTGHLKLRTFRLDACMDRPPPDIQPLYIGTQTALTELTLKFLTVRGGLSECIRKLVALRRLIFCEVNLIADEDRWEHVMTKMAAIPSLRDVDLEAMAYTNTSEDERDIRCDSRGICSRYPGDIVAFKKMFERQKQFAAQGWTDLFSPSFWQICSDGTHDHENFESLNGDDE